jgi:hypothetical protein
MAANEWGMSRIVVEYDYKMLVDALNRKYYDRSPIGVLVRDARMLARLNFSSFSFEFQRRNYNKVAHAMAALGLSVAYGDGQLWPNYVPDDVSVLVARDLAMLTV